MLQFAKVLALTSLSTAEGTNKASIRDTVIGNAQKVTSEILNLVVDLWILGQRSVAVPSEGDESNVVVAVTLKDRVSDVQTFLANVLLLAGAHYKSFAEIIAEDGLQEAPSDQMQTQYHSLAADFKNVASCLASSDKGISGTLAWSASPGWWLSTASAQDVGQELFSKEDVAVLETLRTHRQVILQTAMRSLNFVPRPPREFWAHCANHPRVIRSLIGFVALLSPSGQGCAHGTAQNLGRVPVHDCAWSTGGVPQ